MKILFATSNKTKVANAQAAMSPFGIGVEQVEMDLNESRSFDPDIIALEKAEQAYTKLQVPVMVEDSGFFIRASGNFPMTLVKFSLQTLGIDKILKAMEHENDRHAEWRMSVAFAYGDGKYKVFTFIEPGEIAREVRPVKRAIMSDYWKIYIPKTDSGNSLALSEMEEEALKLWRDYHTKNNQFTMLAKWLTNEYSHGN